MKKLLVLLSLVSASASATAQTIPNAGFENWSIIFSPPSDKPDDWTTNNSISAIYIVKDTDRFAGNYAMRIKANGTATVKFAATQALPVLYYHAKRTIVANDTLTVSVKTYLGGSVVHSPKWEFNAAITDTAYGLWMVPVNISTSTCDTIEIKFTGGKLAGTSWLIDDLYFGYAAGVPVICKANELFYPNPMRVQATLTFYNPEKKQYCFRVFDMQGRQVWQQQTKEDSVVFDRGHLTAGLYYYSLTGRENQTVVNKFIIAD